MDRTNWSDVVRFFNDSFTFTGVTHTLGIAYLMSDGENGLPSIALVNGVTAFVTLPDALNSNNLFAQETLVGNGIDDITPYSPSASTTYNIHSDAALTPDPPDVVIQPGTLLVPPPGMMNKPHLMLPPIIETLAETDAAGPGGVHSVLDLVGGVVATDDGGDVISYTPLGPGLGTDIRLIFSDPPEGSPLEMESYRSIGDETVTSGYIVSEDPPVPAPEPAIVLLLASGLLGLAAVSWKQRRRQDDAPKDGGLGAASAPTVDLCPRIYDASLPRRSLRHPRRRQADTPASLGTTPSRKQCGPEPRGRNLALRAR
jgi:hypothetical protein